MIRIEIVSSTFDERSGSKNGKNWVIREQAGYAHLLDDQGKPMKYPVACSIPLERDAGAYQPGFYPGRKVDTVKFRVFERDRERTPT